MSFVEKGTDERRSGSDRRAYARVPLTFNVEVLFGGRAISVSINNVSLGGILFQSDHGGFVLGDQMIVVFSGTHEGTEFNERIPGKVVTLSRRNDRKSYGVQFMTALYPERYPSLTSFVDYGRRKEVSFLRDPMYGKAERKE
jgi:hypothetical protein